MVLHCCSVPPNKILTVGIADKNRLLLIGNFVVIFIANEMRKITKDVRLGFGSFVDKVLMPYVNTLPDRLESPCSNCESPYSFKHRLDLTQNTSIFGTEVNKTQVSGNLDGPEGGFDALMQAIVCDEVCLYDSYVLYLAISQRLTASVQC